MTKITTLRMSPYQAQRVKEELNNIGLTFNTIKTAYDRLRYKNIIQRVCYGAIKENGKFIQDDYSEELQYL